MRLHDGVRCDRCGAEEKQPGMINPYMSVVAEGNWAVRWEAREGEDQDLCADCVTEADLAAGYERN